MRTTDNPTSIARPARLAVSLLTVGAVGLVGCAPGAPAVPPREATVVEEVPDYYPAEYADLIDSAREEGGRLTIYSSTDEENWAPIIDRFEDKFPFVTEVSALNMESDEIFQRQLSEVGTGNAPADLLVSPSAAAWVNYVEQTEGGIEQYESPETARLPDVAVSMPGVYAMAIDPQVLAYNTSLITEDLESWGDLAQYIEDSDEDFDGRIGVRAPDLSSFNFTVQHALLTAKPELWDSYETFIGLGRPETSTGSLSEKVLAGEYAAAVFATAGAALPVAQQSGGLFELVIPSDGVVALSRSAGIPTTAPHSSTAKLFLDFMLSEEGQQAVQDGGLASYREGIVSDGESWSYQDVVAEVGEDAVVVVPYTAVSPEESDAFQDRWDSSR